VVHFAFVGAGAAVALGERCGAKRQGQRKEHESANDQSDCNPLNAHKFPPKLKAVGSLHFFVLILKPIVVVNNVNRNAPWSIRASELSP
jgi:hypothetical protein